ncbi:MAG: hypothetical protein IPM96_16065 [Ignavibacteria bacterium]|nr:hypothetical protein [Ignavibacteria bacterium]
MSNIPNRNGSVVIATLEQLPAKKQKEVIISEVQTITAEALRCYDKADERKEEIKDLQRLLKETDQVKKLMKLKKEYKELNSTGHALLMELRGIRRMVKKLNPELLGELTQIKEIFQKN